MKKLPTCGLRAAIRHRLAITRRLTLCLGTTLYLLVALWHPAMADSGGDEARYQQALTQARAGKYTPALATLKELLDQHPAHLPYLYDYLTVLGWAEQDNQALALLPRLEISHAPLYTLESLAKSARNLHRYQTAAEIYREALRRQPQRLTAAIGLASTLADMGRFVDAQGTLEAHAVRQPDHPDILATQAYIMERRGDDFAALRVYERMLRLFPSNRTARRGRILVSARLGAPHLAAALARRAPGLLSPTELEAISSDRTAITIRWGRLPHGDPATRFEETDEAITELETRLQALAVTGRTDSPRALQSRFDLMAAYLDRQRVKEVVALYETLPETARRPPSYVLNTAANAYLQLQQPERARDLLREALEQQPDDFDSRLALVYALVESEAFPEALALVDRLSAEQPAWLGQGPPAYRRENPRRLTADSSAALVRAFADHLGEAQRRLENLSDQAPHNAALRTQKAYVYLWRGWPRRALEDFRIALDIDPRQLDAQTGSSQALLELADYRQGQTLLRGLRPDRRHQIPHRRVHLAPHLLEGRGERLLPLAERVDVEQLARPRLQGAQLVEELFEAERVAQGVLDGLGLAALAEFRHKRPAQQRKSSGSVRFLARDGTGDEVVAAGVRDARPGDAPVRGEQDGLGSCRPEVDACDDFQRFEVHPWVPPGAAAAAAAGRPALRATSI